MRHRIASPDLLDFLTARYKELEATAASLHNTDTDGDGECTCGYPAALLADLASKRSLVAGAGQEGAVLDIMLPEAYYEGYDHAMLNVAGTLGEVFADHPDQKREWYFPI